MVTNASLSGLSILLQTALSSTAKPPGTHFEVVFDILREGYKSWGFPAFGFIHVAVALVLVFAPNWFPANSIWTSGGKRIFGSLMLAFSVLWVGGTFMATYGDYQKLHERVATGGCQISEGFVSNFEPMPAGGHAEESFDVGASHFHYSDFVVTAGFNNTSSHGGPMRQGLYVRICHVGNDIGRLEIRR